MGRLLCTSVGVCLLLGLAAPRGGAEEADTRAELESLLRSPLAADRIEAERRVVSRGPAARPWARAWIEAADVRLRSAGWSTLSRVGSAADLRRAIGALRDDQPMVRALAAEAVVNLAGLLPPPEVPWLPASQAGAAADPVLAVALARRLEESVGKRLPACVFHLGEGIVPALARITTSDRHGGGVRESAVDALARIGGVEARRAIARLASDADMIRRPSWWQALLEVGAGEGLEPAHQLVERWSEAAVLRAAGWKRGPVRAPRALSWRTRTHFYRFLGACPPPDAAGHVAAFLEGRLAACASRRGRIQPSLAVEIVRAYLVLCEPDDDGLANAIEAASAPHGRGSRRREELGGILAALEVYREREVVQASVRDLLDGAAVPQTVEAWGRFLIGGTPYDDLQPLAQGLLQLEGDAVTIAQRRLGARLLDRVGGITPALLQTLLTDVDPWLRAWALGRAQRRTSGVPEAALTAARQAALADPDERLFLLAAEWLGAEGGAACRLRVERLALQGPRRLRDTAWRALRSWAAPAGGEPAWTPAAPAAALDARLAALADFRSRLRVPAAPGSGDGVTQGRK